MQAARAGRVHFVLLTLLDLVPRISLLEHVRIRPANYISAIEKRCVKA